MEKHSIILVVHSKIMSNPEVHVVEEAIQSAVELAADVAAAAGVPPFDVAAAVGGTGTGAEDDNDARVAAAAAASVVQASGAGAPARKKRRTNRKKENPDDVSALRREVLAT